jgi:hypothetical protein
MKKKNLLFTAVAMIGLTSATMAQVPNYLPTNGLVGWWPFNGNANDESGSGNNGTVNGATLTVDRNGQANKAYSFDGVNDFIEISHNSSFNSYPFSINAWVIKNDLTRGGIVNHYNTCSNNGAAITSINGNFSTYYYSQNGSLINRDISTISMGIGNWQMVTSVFSNDSCFQYLNGILVASNIFDVLNPTPNSSSNTVSLNFGLMPQNLIVCPNDPNYFHNGNIDDIGIWNRALTQQEITDVYNGNICYQNITVTDTLLINMGITGFNPITYSNTIKIFPNPTNDHITINYGNFASLIGYQLKIINSLGQQVFQTNVVQQSDYLNLTTWGGNGLYFVQIIDQQGNIIDIRKIVLQ